MSSFFLVTTTRVIISHVAAGIRARVEKLVSNMIADGVHLCVHNVEIRYEDPHGELSQSLPVRTCSSHSKPPDSLGADVSSSALTYLDVEIHSPFKMVEPHYLTGAAPPNRPPIPIPLTRR
ncbi:hypothetical protein N9L68_05740, partial [bacterium]|nr:hypothetical protein [bacterium]